MKPVIKTKNRLYVVLLFLVFFATKVVFAQEKRNPLLKQLDSLILAKNYAEANKALSFQIDSLKTNRLNAHLVSYPYYVGKITLKNYDIERATKTLSEFLEGLKQQQVSNKIMYEALMSEVEFYDEVGDLNRSLKTTQKALQYILEAQQKTPEEVGKVYYNLGVSHLSLGTVDSSKVYFKKALKTYKTFPKTSNQNLSDAYNANGAVMWMTSKLDSATYYYKLAVKQVLSENKSTPKNRLQAATIRSNMSLLEYSKSNFHEAIEIQKEVISDYQKVIENTHKSEEKENANRNQLTAIYNLSAYYTEIGNLQKAKDFIEYSYNKAKAILEPKDSRLIEYKVALGQSELSLLNYDKAIRLFKEGIHDYEINGVKNEYWKGIANYGIGKAFFGKDDYSKTTHYFNIAEEQLHRVLNDEYSTDYLGLLREKSLLYAKTNKAQEAVNIAEKGYAYLKGNSKENHFSLHKSILNLSEVNYMLKNYNEALKWADHGISIIEKSELETTNQFSKVQLNFSKPSLLLSKAKAKFALSKAKDSVVINTCIGILRNATNVLEKRKIVADDAEDINVLIDEYKQINDFHKELYYSLFKITNKSILLDSIVTLHESGVYQKIRAKMNLRHNIRFKNVPDSILNLEKELKKNISLDLENKEEGVATLFENLNNWNHFLNTLKITYPEYYKMRYATIIQPLNNLTTNKDVTVVRFIFIENNLIAFVINSNGIEHFDLGALDLKKHINTLTHFNDSFEDITAAMYDLYNNLWEPIKASITTKSVVIIPDAELFNLNFELLTTENINSYKALATKSLLANYNISYNYSLLLLDSEERKTLDFKENYVAFAPEFDSSMKTDYIMAVTDSLYLDKGYLTLLPQPFSSELVKRIGKKFNGDYFLNKNASKKLFISNAKEHKIIHIGTHAESNNVNPELSRLVFAKDLSNTEEINDNYLYAYEIYNQNLSSNLAILTACETGKPTYQPGEGMISLAHAFNYAGSDSILTSLWEIDEQSSMQIVDNFYKFLSEGLPKDIALKNAKLDYLKVSNGRTLHPQYWSGLILMGNTDAISLSQSNNLLIWVIASAIVLLLLLGFLLKKRPSQNE